MSGISSVNFEHISHFILQLILLNLSKEMPPGPEKLQFVTVNLSCSNQEKYIVLWAGRAICSHVYSPNIKTSRKCFKKISQTLLLLCEVYLKCSPLSQVKYIMNKEKHRDYMKKMQQLPKPQLLSTFISKQLDMM